MPISTGQIFVPARLHMIATQDFSSRKFSATVAVTSCPHWVTPSSTTPLSAHMMTSAFRSICTSPVRWIPAIWINAFSSRPRLPNGFPSPSQCCFAAAMAATSTGRIFCIVSSSVILDTSCMYLQNLVQTPGWNNNTDVEIPPHSCFLPAYSPIHGYASVLPHEMRFHYPNCQNNEIHGQDLLQDLTPQELQFPVFHGKSPDSASK